MLIQEVEAAGQPLRGEDVARGTLGDIIHDCGHSCQGKAIVLITCVARHDLCLCFIIDPLQVRGMDTHEHHVSGVPLSGELSLLHWAEAFQNESR